MKLEQASDALVRDMGKVKSKFLAEWNLMETRSFAPQTAQDPAERQERLSRSPSGQSSCAAGPRPEVWRWIWEPSEGEA